MLTSDSTERNPLEVLLTVPADRSLAGVTGQAIQGYAEAFGMPSQTGMVLGLAGEEIIAFASEHSEGSSPISLRCRDGRYRMIVELSFAVSGFNPRLFNLPRMVSLEDEEDVKELGLLLIARTVDNFALSVDGGQVRLVLEKFRSYPSLKSGSLKASGSSTFSIKSLTPDRLAQFCEIAASARGAPAFLTQPGRLIDMAEVGEIAGCVAEGADGIVAGGCVWLPGIGKIVECFGPYVEPQAAEVVEQLVEACLISMARSSALGVICRHSGPHFPKELFDQLGLYGEEGVFYRQLQEDMGALVWSVTEIEHFLSGTYRRLGFARDIRMVEDSGQRQPKHSVISVSMNRDSAEVILKPCWPGADATENVESHRAHLVANGLSSLSFEIDLGIGWQLAFVPGLLAAGFSPAYVIPHGGRGDLLVFVWFAAKSS
jgi:anti-sigma regulatory factor (Ser/Thr protein kinase)